MNEDSKVLRNLKSMMGNPNYWTKEPITENSTYNDLIFNYWHYFDGFPEAGYFHPNDLTSFTSIDRIIRELPNRQKNISEAERMRIYYAKS